MNIIDKYLSLVKQRRFSEGLPLIEEIVRGNPDMATSQFNYGICLAELTRYSDAARAFLRAFELDPENGGALYRGCIALAAANDDTALLDVFRRECARDPEMIQLFLEEERFASFWKLPGFIDLKNQYDT